MPGTHTILRPLQDFLKTEAATGLFLLAMVPIALVWVNSSYASSYDTLWTTDIGVHIGRFDLSMDFRQWINDGLMTIFFFVVGLEIKREFVDGDLRDRRKALTPVAAAIGGMTLPALTYALFNVGHASINGWGIPMATDIAIVLGFLALLGNRVPSALKTFLLTLAIVDDVGAIAVIAVFYSDKIHFAPLLVAALCVVATYILGRINRRQPVVVVLLSIAAWTALHESGVHATLIGVALALATPATPIQNRDFVDGEALSDVSSLDAAIETVTIARHSVSSVEWLQHLFHPWSSFLILPLFALANSGIEISRSMFDSTLSSPVALGVIVGLLIGKPVGISIATYIAIRLGGSLPKGVTFKTLIAASILGGIGFTVSLFVADLAFNDEQVIREAKLAILGASVIAGALGAVLLRLTLPKYSLHDVSSQ